MAKKSGKNTKSKIVNAAWKLFYEQGYDETTVEEIVEESCTSKGSFYHYFEGKDALLSSLSYIFDEKYEELMENIDPEMTCYDKLLYLNKELFFMIENRISLELLARLYSSQLVTKGDKHLLDQNRVYYKVIRHIAIEGKDKGEFREDVSVNDIVKAYTMCERAILYDWCICNGDYSLSNYSSSILPMFLSGFLKKI